MTAMTDTGLSAHAAAGAHRGSNPAHLPGQLLEVLRGHTMTLDQIHTYFGVKYRQQLRSRLEESGAASLREYLERLASIFEITGDRVKARPTPHEKNPSLATVRYADTSSGIRTILEASPGYCLPLADIDAAFEVRHGVTIVSVVGMAIEEYLARKPQIFGVDGTKAYLQPEFLARMKKKAEADADKADLEGVKPEKDPAKEPAKPEKDPAKEPAKPEKEPAKLKKEPAKEPAKPEKATWADAEDP